MQSQSKGDLDGMVISMEVTGNGVERHDGGERQGEIDGITNYIYIERFSHTYYS